MSTANPALPARNSTGSSRYRPELELLFTAVGALADPKAQALVRHLVDQPIDWEFLVETARQHRILPLLYRAVIESGVEDRIPESLRTPLRDVIFENARRSLLLIREVMDLLGELQRLGIKGIPYKGPVLSAALYGDTSLRQCGDLDIIVPKQDVPRAMQMLEQRGYVCVTTHETADKDRRFIRADGWVVLELHWAITARHFACEFDLDSLWDGFESIQIAGQQIRRMSSENMLLVLTVHGTKHHWARLLWICDIVRLLQVYPDLNWDSVFRRASAYGIARMLRLSLVLARDLGGADLPDPARSFVAQEPKVQVLSANIIDSIVSGSSRHWSRAEKAAFLFSVRERRLDQIRLATLLFAHRLKPSPADEDWIPLPKSLKFFHYPVRVVRVLQNRSAGLLKRLFKSASE